VQEIIPEWQTAASALLVAIGVRHCNDVMAELLEKFQPGVLPHYFVVQTLANLATANGKYSVALFAVVILTAFKRQLQTILMTAENICV